MIGRSAWLTSRTLSLIFVVYLVFPSEPCLPQDNAYLVTAPNGEQVAVNTDKFTNTTIYFSSCVDVGQVGNVTGSACLSRHKDAGGLSPPFLIIKDLGLTFSVMNIPHRSAQSVETAYYRGGQAAQIVKSPLGSAIIVLDTDKIRATSENGNIALELKFVSTDQEIITIPLSMYDAVLEVSTKK